MEREELHKAAEKVGAGRQGKTYPGKGGGREKGYRQREQQCAGSRGYWLVCRE